MSVLPRTAFPPPTRSHPSLERLLAPRDIGDAHVRDWHLEQRLQANRRAYERADAILRERGFFNFKPNTMKPRPVSIDDADGIDGDHEMYGSYAAHEWGV